MGFLFGVVAYVLVAAITIGAIQYAWPGTDYWPLGITFFVAWLGGSIVTIIRGGTK